MANATPVTKKPDAKVEAPAKAEDRLMPEAAPLASKKAAPAAVKADPADLQAMVAEAEAAGKKATIFGNAVRVDH